LYFARCKEFLSPVKWWKQKLNKDLINEYDMTEPNENQLLLEVKLILDELYSRGYT